MPTATKNSKIKNKKGVVNNRTNHDDAEEVSDINPSKIKKSLVVDEPEPVVAIEEKLEEDPLLGSVEEEDGLEDVGIDELNPFGDRWEE